MSNVLTDILNSGSSAVIVREGLERSPEYRVTRKRMAAALQKGFDAWDTYQAARPYLFALGLLMAGAGATMAWKRRKQSKEAPLAWGATAVAGLGLAWFTRPDWLLPPAAAPETGPGSSPMVEAVDRWAEDYAKQPGWPETTYRRLTTMPGFKDQYDRLPAAVQAVLV